MKVSKETIATVGIIAVMIIPLYYQMWDIKDSISELTERVVRVEEHVVRVEERTARLEVDLKVGLEAVAQELSTEIKLNRLHNAHHRHHDTGEVYYERDIVRGASASAGNETDATAHE